MNELEIKKGDKIYIIGNGNQAPYGIGEIMEIFPASQHKKIHKYMSRYYNAPTMRINGKNGQRVGFDWYYDGKKESLVGFCIVHFN